MAQLNDRIRIIREQMHLTQADFAEVGGVSLTSQQNYERGSRSPDAAYLSRLHDAGIDLQFLFSGNAKNLPDGCVQIPKMSARGSMGIGIPTALDHDSVIESIIVDMNELRRRLPTFSNPSNLRIITAVGQSMQPTYADGDALLVDVGIDEFKNEGVYVIEVNDRLWIKRLTYLLDGGIQVMSDNKAYPTQVIRDGDILRVIGRVLGRWSYENIY